MELRTDIPRIFYAFLCLSIAVTPFTQCYARVSKQSIKHSHHTKYPSNSKLPTGQSRHHIITVEHTEMDSPASTLSNDQPYVSSPFSLPPFDSLAPMPLPENTPPFCEYPPSTPQPPSTVIPTPITYTLPPPPPPEISYSTPPFPIQNPPPSPSLDIPSPPESSPTPTTPEYGPSPPSFTPGTPEYVPNPPSTTYTPGTPVYFPSPNPPYIPGTPEYVPSPPSPPSFVPGTPEYVPSPPSPPSFVPGSPEYVPSPPDYYVPSPPEFVAGPPGFGPSPPSYFPSPIGYTPSPIVFQPPVVYPPPAVPPPQYRAPRFALWCVVKPAVPDPIIEEAMSYACGSGADCGSIQQNGACYQPDTLIAHASYAFNSYWQRTKAAGGTCDFGGTGMLVTVDPSFDGCHFIYY